MKTITPMKAWMKAATTAEQEHLAEKLETSRATLYQYASGHRDVSVSRAAEIEAVTTEMARASKGRLPAVLRTDLVPACSSCPYAQRCLGERAVASQFLIIAG